jgi:hypothetical protein
MAIVHEEKIQLYKGPLLNISRAVFCPSYLKQCVNIVSDGMPQ